MRNQSSGCYVIDSDYTIINANETARGFYPQLKMGEKCYKCLMGRDEPCESCPVVNGVKGPFVFLNPIRDISEMVDSVDINIKEHGECHMLIFSVIEQDNRYAITLPSRAEELNYLGLIKGLTSDYYDVFSVRVDDGSVIIYRLKGKPLESDSVYAGELTYTEEIENYIQKYVVADDREMLRKACDLTTIKETLKDAESIVLHYRVILDGEIHYFVRKMVRIGDADSFENIVVGISCEDEAVHRRESQISLQNTLRKVEIDAKTGLLNKEAFFIYGDKFIKDGKSADYDLCFLRIDNLDSISHQYGPIVKNQVVQVVGEVLKGYLDEIKCPAYMRSGIFACFVKKQDASLFHSFIESFGESVRQKSNNKNIIVKWFLYKQITPESVTEDIYNKSLYIINTVHNNIPKDYIELDQQMMEQMEWDISVEQNFQKALDNGEFKVWYQPKYSVETKTITGAEALVRWFMEDGTMVPPNKFIPILENNGLICHLDEEIFRQVCIFQKKLHESNIPQVPISVNLSRTSIFTKDIPKLYSDIIEEYGIPHSLIPIEITESAAIEASMMKEFADEMIKNGFALHMDDFGSGYSSLASLQMLPFECIKIDRSLVVFVGNQSGESLLKHTIAFAKETGLHVVVEGVERSDQFRFLKVAGCDAIQGYFFSKPVDEAAFWKMLEEMDEDKAE